MERKGGNHDTIVTQSLCEEFRNKIIDQGGTHKWAVDGFRLLAKNMQLEDRSGSFWGIFRVEWRLFSRSIRSRDSGSLSEHVVAVLTNSKLAKVCRLLLFLLYST